MYKFHTDARQGEWGVRKPRRVDFAGTEGWDHAFRFSPHWWIKRYHTPLLDTSISLFYTLKKMFKIKYSHYFFYLKMSLKRGPKTKKTKHIMEGGRVVSLSTSCNMAVSSLLPVLCPQHHSHWQLSTMALLFWKVLQEKESKPSEIFMNLSGPNTCSFKCLCASKACISLSHNLARLATTLQICALQNPQSCAATIIITFVANLSACGTFLLNFSEIKSHEAMSQGFKRTLGLCGCGLSWPFCWAVGANVAVKSSSSEHWGICEHN